MSKLKQREFPGTMIESNYLLTRKCKGKTNEYELTVLDVETSLEKIIPLEWETPYPPWFYQLPNNRILCVLFIENTANIEIFQFASNNSLLHEKSARVYDTIGDFSDILFWKDFIYIVDDTHLGECRLRKWWLSKNKTLYLSQAKIENRSGNFNTNSICFEDKILFGSRGKDLHSYDLYVNSYSMLPNAVSGGNKLYFNGKGRLYYIAENEIIYESGLKSPFNWNKIADFPKKLKDFKLWSTVYNNCAYFRGFYWDYKGEINSEFYYVIFDLQTKTFHEKGIMKS